MKEMAERGRTLTRPLYRELKDYAAQLGIRDMIYLNIGEPDFPTPLPIVEAAKKAMDEGFTHYTEERGILELREGIAERLKAEKGLDIDPKEGILITNGSSDAIFLTILSLVDPGDEVVLPEPYYPPFLSAIKLASGKPVTLPLNRDTLTLEPDQVAAAVGAKTKLMVVNSPCNPTGMVYGKDVLKAVAELAVDHDFYVVSDEVYDRFVYDGAESLSIAAFPGMTERTLILNSFSKTYAMTGWRIGYVAGDGQRVSRILRVKGAGNVCPNSIAQKAAVAALREGEPYVARMLKEYAERRQLVWEALQRLPAFRCPKPQGAFYLLPDVSAVEKDSLKFAKYLIKEAHVVVGPGVAFGPSGEGRIRISYSASKENLTQAFERLRQAVENYGG